MEAINLPELLKIVQDIIVQSPLLLSTSDSSILPSSIKPLPQLSTNLPESPLPLAKAIERLTTHVLPYLNASSLSPSYYGFVTGGATPAALIADIITTIMDQNVAVHLPKETIASNVEVAVLNMLVDLFHLPKDHWAVGTTGDGGGNLTTGATASNVQGLALGREYALSKAVVQETGKSMSVGEHGLMEVYRAASRDKVKVLSTLPHSSIAKAASIVGIGRANIISINKPGNLLEIDIDRLRELAATSKQDRVVYILAISTGEVNTGHFATGSEATMQELRKICDEHNIWIHADGAFGLFARILLGQPHTEQYTPILEGVQGVELADSITADGHKLLNVPYDCGFFFTRHKHLSEQVFINGNAAYLTPLEGASGDYIQSPLNIGIENSRRFRALPAYLTLSAYGRGGYINMLKNQIDLARKVVAWLWDHEAFEVLPHASTKEEAVSKTFMIALFKARDAAINAVMVKNINNTGRIYVSGTQWEGETAARIAVSNWRADPDRDFPIIVDVLCRFAQSLA